MTLKFKSKMKDWRHDSMVIKELVAKPDDHGEHQLHKIAL